jgi:hypothetical protein
VRIVLRAHPRNFARETIPPISRVKFSGPLPISVWTGVL